MFHIDPNVNAAIERQLERVRAVQAFQASPEPARSAVDSDQPRWVSRRAALALTAAPIMVLVAAVVLMTR